MWVREPYVDEPRGRDLAGHPEALGMARQDVAHPGGVGQVRKPHAASSRRHLAPRASLCRTPVVLRPMCTGCHLQALGHLWPRLSREARAWTREMCAFSG